MNADIYLTNISDKKMAIGIISIAPGETKKILKKIFDRKASYVTRMIKEEKLAFYAPDIEAKIKKNISAPTKDETLKENNGNVQDKNVAQKENTSVGENDNLANNTKTDKADALETAEKPKDETAEKPKDTKKAPASKRRQRKK